MTSVQVLYDPDVDGNGVGRRQLTVAGEPDESFVRALVRGIGAQPTQMLQLAIRDEAGDVAYWCIVDDGVTVQQAAEFADGKPLPIDIMGRGGQEFDYFISLVGGGLDIVGIWQVCVGGAELARVKKYRSQRRAAREWVDAGTETTPSSELAGFVRHERSWQRPHFDRVFGLDVEPGGKLLRSLAYRQVSSTPDVWMEAEET